MLRTVSLVISVSRYRKFFDYVESSSILVGGTMRQDIGHNGMVGSDRHILQMLLNGRIHHFG